MSDIQQNGVPPVPSTNSNASQSGRAGSPPVVGNAPLIASTPAQQPARSYAHATKNAGSGPAAQAASSTTGANRNAPPDSLNGRPVASKMAAPAIANSGTSANGASAPAGHSRKPSRTISASGSSGQIPNGGPTTPSSSRPNLMFGNIPAGGHAPAIANSTPSQSTSSMPVPRHDPRVTSPTASPSPIPQPAASGGRPNLSGQSNPVSFGSLPVLEMDGSVSSFHSDVFQPDVFDNKLTVAQRQNPTPQQPPAMPAQNTHYRRASSQSQQAEMQNSGVPMGPSGGRGGFMSGPGRGRGGYPQPYSQHMAYSPALGYRSMPGGQRPGSQFPPHFQSQVQLAPHQASPHAQPRSPAPSMGSGPATPQMQQMQMAHAQPMPYAPQYPGYMNQIGQQPAPFSTPAQFDPSYSYYGQSYAGQPGYMPPGPPQSPRHFRQVPPTPHAQHLQGHYNHPPSQNMSRTSSQVSAERPNSSLGSVPQPPQTTSTPVGNQSSHSHSQSTSTAATAAPNFTIPRKEKKGILIKNAEGEVVTFDKKPSPSPSVAKSPSPGAASSDPTPPPRSSSTSSHVRADSKAGKSAAEIKAEFQEQVKKEQEKEKQIKEENDGGLSAEQAVEDFTSTPSKEGANSKPQVNVEPVSATETRPDTEADQGDKITDLGGAETDEQREKRLREEEEERMIAEMEAAEHEEEERERQFQEKKKRDAEEKAAKEKEEAAKADERMKQAERDAEAAEEARQQQKPQDEENAEAKAERERMFDSLKKPSVGPGAESQNEQEVSTPPASEEPTSLPKSAKVAGLGKPKPLPLKLETAKPVEAPQQTPGMRSLKSARMLQLRNEAVIYPEGVQSPNPALNQSGKRGGRMYDKNFLMQFQDAFKEKPDVDWDKRLKETLGDPTDSSAPKSARTPSGAGSRVQSHRSHPPSAFTPQAPMGSFANSNRALPSGTTSEQRFAAANQGRTVNNPLANFAANRGASFPMPPQMGRQQSMGGGMPPPHHPARVPTSRGGSKGGTRVESQRSRKEHEKDNQKMPLTANASLKPLEASGSGWKPTSVGRTGLSMTDPSPNGHLAPDMVQRKVKSNLNKMTPERFEKIADQILAITAQSKDESDGRTLRQVIALTFEKACDEAHWASMYAKFCKRMLEDMTQEIKDENVRDKQGNPVVGGNLFRKYLLNRCQEEFERGWEVNLPMKEEGSGEAAMMSDEYYVAAAAKRKGLGLIQFIGELYKLSMLSIRIMHQCVHRLLDFDGVPEESTIESLTKLLRTVGAQMAMNEQGAPYVKSYFERIERIMSMEGLPSRMHFMLLVSQKTVESLVESSIDLGTGSGGFAEAQLEIEG